MPKPKSAGRSGKATVVREKLPRLPKADVIAVLSSDWHLSDTSPPARSGEIKWYRAMFRAVDQIRQVVLNYGKPPLFIVGDLFDKGKPTHELVGFAAGLLRSFPNKVYAIPGQHDLVFHNLNNLHQSAYWTLVSAGVICDLMYGFNRISDGFYCWAFPWGKEVTPRTGPADGIDLCVAHSYVWGTKSTAFPGAPESAQLKQWIERCSTYTAAAFGDQHRSIIWRPKTGDRGRLRSLFNCGCLLRRKSNERDFRPCIGLLMSDGNIIPHELDISQDVFSETSEKETQTDIVDGDFDELIQEVKKPNSAYDFVRALRTSLKDTDISISKGATQIILEAIEEIDMSGDV